MAARRNGQSLLLIEGALSLPLTEMNAAGENAFDANEPTGMHHVRSASASNQPKFVRHLSQSHAGSAAIHTTQQPPRCITPVMLNTSGGKQQNRRTATMTRRVSVSTQQAQRNVSCERDF